MKKKYLTLIILFIFTILLVTGCSKKEAISTDKFKKIMEDKNYTIDDMTTQMKSYTYVDNLLYATSKNNYVIEFYKIDNKDDATQLFTNMKNELEESNTTKKQKNISLKDYEKYELTTDDTYFVLTKIDNTLLYVSADKKFKNEINKTLSSIDY